MGAIHLIENGPPATDYYGAGPGGTLSIAPSCTQNMQFAWKTRVKRKRSNGPFVVNSTHGTSSRLVKEAKSSVPFPNKSVGNMVHITGAHGDQYSIGR